MFVRACFANHTHTHTQTNNTKKTKKNRAFSATGAIEGVSAIKTGELLTLSEQELVDCDGTTGNAGCSGGLMDYAFEFVKANGGIDTEEDYSYWSGWGFSTWCNQRKLHDR